MELEADLGIDSIKRVEILSAMRERAPNLPEVKPTELQPCAHWVKSLTTCGLPVARPWRLRLLRRMLRYPLLPLHLLAPPLTSKP
jgi:hypothetical protein